MVVDRLTVREDIRQRLVDSLEVCAREADGRIELVLLADDPVETRRLLETRFPQVRWTSHPAGTLVKFSEKFECQLCHTSYEEPEPRLFSFNNPYGACSECQGFGNTINLDLGLVIPDESLSLSEGAIHPWTKPRYRSFQNRLLHFAEKNRIPVDRPVVGPVRRSEGLDHPGQSSVPRRHRLFRLPGTEEVQDARPHLHQPLPRVHHLQELRRGAAAARGTGRLRRRKDESPRSRAMTTLQASRFFVGVCSCRPAETSIAAKILEEIRHRLDLLVRVGLEYLTLDRLSSTLSGGESQRIQLATSLGSMLAGALYVLDEPSIGLHPRDSRRLVETLQSLKGLGNTVVVVEHDPEIMRSADHIIDLGPRAGENGGRLIFEGDYPALTKGSEFADRPVSGRRTENPGARFPPPEQRQLHWRSSTPGSTT